MTYSGGLCTSRIRSSSSPHRSSLVLLALELGATVIADIDAIAAIDRLAGDCRGERPQRPAICQRNSTHSRGLWPTSLLDILDWT